MAQYIAQRTTSQGNSESRIVRQVRDEIGLLEPDVAPLITILNMMKQRKPVKGPKWSWFEQDYAARWGQNSNNTYGTGVTSIDVVDGTLFTAGDLFAVCGVTTTNPELCRVTAVATNTLTIVRNVGGGALASIPANCALRLAGNAYEEGALPPGVKMTAPVETFSATQIFRKAMDITKTAAATEVYGTNGDRQHEQMIKLRDHKMDMNAALLFGRYSESFNGGPTGKPIRTTRGLLATIATNKTDCGGLLTFKTFEAFSRSVFRYGPKRKTLVCAPLLKSAINAWGIARMMVKPGDNEFGLNITEVETAHGVFNVVNDWMLENGVSGQSGFGNMALALDTKQVMIRYLKNNKEDRDTSFYENVLRDGSDRYLDEYMSELGFEIRQEKYHGLLYNFTDYVQ